MTSLDTIAAARALLETVTPLRGDCGTRCAAACCRPDEDGQGGMLLLPGEEAFYAPAPAWAKITDSGLRVRDQPLSFLACDGTCDRANRPLSCRIFPLTPVIAQNGNADVVLDVRAWPVCPLMPHGLDGLSRDFTSAVRTATALLWEDELLRAYLALLTEQLRAFSSF